MKYSSKEIEGKHKKMEEKHKIIEIERIIKIQEEQECLLGMQISNQNKTTEREKK